MAQTWLICGGRDFADPVLFLQTMRELVRLRKMPVRIVHGGAHGADTMADNWARDWCLEVIRCPADWERLGRKAGPMRNEQMLVDHKPDLVVAFPGGRGTADMVKRAKAAGVHVIIVGGPQ